MSAQQTAHTPPREAAVVVTKEFGGIAVCARCCKADDPGGGRYEVELEAEGQRAVVDLRSLADLLTSLDQAMAAFAATVGMRVRRDQRHR